VEKLSGKIQKKKCHYELGKGLSQWPLHWKLGDRLMYNVVSALFSNIGLVD